MGKSDKQIQYVLSTMVLYRDWRLAKILWDRAIITDDKKLAGELIMNGICVNGDNSGLLEQAAEQGSYRVVKKLVNNGYTQNYQEAVRIAVANDNFLIARYIAKRMESLEGAVELGDFELVKSIFPWKKPEDIAEGLRCAVETGKLRLVKFFLENGADPNAKQYLMIALQHRYVEIADILIDAGADVNQANEIEKLLKLAISTRSVSLVKKIIEREVKEDDEDEEEEKDEMSREALIEQAIFETGDFKIAKILIEKGIPIPSTLLAKAVLLNDYKIFHFLAENGASIDLHHQQFGYFQKSEDEVDQRIVEELKEKYGFEGRFLYFSKRE